MLIISTVGEVEAPVREVSRRRKKGLTELCGGKFKSKPRDQIRPPPISPPLGESTRIRAALPGICMLLCQSEVYLSTAYFQMLNFIRLKVLHNQYHGKS